MPIKLFKCAICGMVFSEEYYENAEDTARACEAQGSTPYRFEVGEMVVVPYEDFRAEVRSRGLSPQDHGNRYIVQWQDRIGWRQSTFDEQKLLGFNPREATAATAETEATSAAQS